VSLKDNVKSVRERIINAQQQSGNNRSVEIIAITKTHPSIRIEEIVNTGLRSIGENRVQEAEDKFNKIPEILPRITKRLVGHLQSNKINKALQIFDTIDSVDSLKLASKIGEKSILSNKSFPVLLEINTSGEGAKFGFALDNTDEMLACFGINGIEIQGLMTVGPLTSNRNKIRDAFITMRNLFENLKSQLPPEDKFVELSMGMSGDFEIAVEEGATMVRLGTILFGTRGIYK
jgi:pyridoxal phosphate enzyme (YggS family)